MTSVDFSVPAGVFETRRGGAFPHQKLRYQTFQTLAEAIEYVMEDMPKSSVSPRVEIEGREFDHADIRQLYRSDGYPLHRIERQGV